MRFVACLLLAIIAHGTFAAELESRVLTHYVPQDFLENVVRTEAWTELPVDVKGGVRKDDVVRIWAGGLIDRGNGDQPGENTNGPEGVALAGNVTFALSPQSGRQFALLLKSESTAATPCKPAGKPLEIKLTKDKEKVWIGFNDERGRYADNHLGKGRRHELDPLWVRIEVVRVIVD
jgi:hypothetical protein